MACPAEEESKGRPLLIKAEFDKAYDRKKVSSFGAAVDAARAALIASA
jgi:hypothetical protein